MPFAYNALSYIAH